LMEYPGVAEASQGFASMFQAGAVSAVPEPGLGNKATFWTLDKEGSGFVVMEGKRVLSLDARWRDSSLPAGAKERLRPIAEATVGKM